MGRATRWLRSLLGRKKDAKVQKEDAGSDGYPTRDKKRWSFAEPRQPSDGSVARSPASALETAWLRSFYDDGEVDGKRAMAVAVATAAAANAAVTAAQVAMVRLKSLGRGRTTTNGRHEWRAAVKIQTAFRCYLVRLNPSYFVKRSHFYVSFPFNFYGISRFSGFALTSYYGSSWPFNRRRKLFELSKLWSSCRLLSEVNL